MWDLYDYDMLIADVERFRRLGVDVEVVGESVCGRSIFCLHLGSYDGAQTIIQGAIHARESVTSALIVRQIALYSQIGLLGGIYFLPMTNPDGVQLCAHGLSSVGDAARRAFLFEVNGGSNDFRYWKANIRAVDLNTNFDARWGSGALNVTYPAPENYIGPYPNSEPETQALVELTSRVQPQFTISYHSKGQEIYWKFYQEGEQRARDLAVSQLFSALTGYPTMDYSSAGGYKDFCIQDFAIPALTFEIVGADYEHPVPIAALDGEEWQRNRGVPKLAAIVAAEQLEGMQPSDDISDEQTPDMQPAADQSDGDTSSDDQYDSMQPRDNQPPNDISNDQPSDNTTDDQLDGMQPRDNSERSSQK